MVTRIMMVMGMRMILNGKDKGTMMTMGTVLMSMIIITVIIIVMWMIIIMMMLMINGNTI